MSQPAPKQSIWQILLFATVVFLAFNLFFMPKQSDPRTADQIMQSIRSQAQTIKNRAAQEHRSIHDIITELDNGSTAKSGKIDFQTAFDQLSAEQDLEQMRLLNELVLDQSIQGVEGQYDAKVDANGGLPKEDKEDKKVLASMLVADTQLKAAAERQDIQRISLASDRVLNVQRFHTNDSIWRTPVEVAANPQFPRTSV